MIWRLNHGARLCTLGNPLTLTPLPTTEAAVPELGREALRGPSRTVISRKFGVGLATGWPIGQSVASRWPARGQSHVFL